MEHGEQVHLLLSAPGQPPVALPPSPWRGWIWTERGPIDPVTAAQTLRLSPVSPRAERALVAAVQADDVDSLARLAASTGPAQEAACILAALRLASIDTTASIDLLARIASAPSDLTANKVVRRHWGALVVQVALAPSVPVLFGLGRTSLSLLLAELLADTGRSAEALTVLESLPPAPPVVLARVAALLALGEHQKVLAATATLPNVDDMSALALVARSVAGRSEQDADAAMSAVCAALADSDRHPAVIAAALEERAHLYTVGGDAVAARADMEALAAMAGGRTDVPIPSPSAVRRHDEDGGDEDPLGRARDRMRRRITGVGAPGTFGGRHHSTYRDEIATMFALGQIDAVEELLLGLLDAVEDEVDELGVPLDATFFLTLADLYQDSDRTDDLVALRERYAAADARARRISAEPPVTGPSLAKPPAPASAVEDEARLAAALREPVSDVAAVAPATVAASAGESSPHQPSSAIGLVEPDDAPPAEQSDGSAAEPAPERELTAVERAVRGPRVRSL